MMRFLCLFVVVLLFVKCKSRLKQERAVMNYCNPKYVDDCYAITRRERRGEPYKTNFTIFSKYTGGNNVTMKVVLMSGFTVELVKVPVCEIGNIKWLSDFLKLYGDFDTNCPHKPGKYGLYNLEFPPKDMPQTLLNLLKGKFYAKFFFQATKTEEVLIESTLIFQAY